MDEKKIGVLESDLIFLLAEVESLNQSIEDLHVDEGVLLNRPYIDLNDRVDNISINIEKILY